MKKGFTLIELLAVIVILAVILAIAIPSISSVIDESKLSALNADANNIAKALEFERVNNSNIDVAQVTKNDLQSLINIDGSSYEGFGVSLVDGKVVVSIINDGLVAQSAIVAKTYGVAWDGISSTLTRTDDAVGLTYTVNTSTITSDFDGAEIYNEMTQVTDSYGNIFIKIPKFYIKKTVSGNNWKWQISKNKQDNDYYLPDCFFDQASGKILPYILVGKYDASLSSDTTKMESKSGSFVMVRKSLDQLRPLAKANGSGYQLIDVHMVDLLQVLFYVEFATLDSQSIMKGFSLGCYNTNHVATVATTNSNIITINNTYASAYRVGQAISIGTSMLAGNVAKDRIIMAINTTTGEITFDGAPVSIAIGNFISNTAFKNGSTNSVSTASGSPVSNTDGKNAMKYRGIENLWGNVWEFIDGINVKDYVTYVAKDASQYASNVFSGAYTKISYTNSSTVGNNFVVKMGYDSDNPFIQLPVEVVSGNSTTSMYKDYFINASGNRVAVLGGIWSNNIVVSKTAGISTWVFNCASTSSDFYITSRLMKADL